MILMSLLRKLELSVGGASCICIDPDADKEACLLDWCKILIILFVDHLF